MAGKAYLELLTLLGIWPVSADASVATGVLETEREIKLANGNTVRESELNWRDIPNEPGFQSALVYLPGPVESFEIVKRSKPVIHEKEGFSPWHPDP